MCKRISLLVCVLCIAMSAGVFAETRLSARIDWFGVYTVTVTTGTNDPNVKRAIPAPRQGERTDRIPGKEGVRFGYSYVLSGKKGDKVAVKHLYRFPGSGMPTSGGLRATMEQAREDVIGEPVLIGWSFVGAPPESIVTGEWSLEVWQEDKKLVEKKFTVYAP